MCMQANTNEIVAASVVYLDNVSADRPMATGAWNNSRVLRHFSIVRNLSGQMLPMGAPAPSLSCIMQAHSHREYHKHTCSKQIIRPWTLQITGIPVATPACALIPQTKACPRFELHAPGAHAGFKEQVAAANSSELGRRNRGQMLATAAGERALLANLVERLLALDADVYCGHNVAAFDLDVLLHRLQHHKARHRAPLAPYGTAGSRLQALCLAGGVCAAPRRCAHMQHLVMS